MKQTIDEILTTIYRFYRSTKTYADLGPDTEELVAARRQAGSDGPYEQWRAMLRRLRDRFPGHSVTNRSHHLPTGNLDAGYAGRLSLPPSTGEESHSVGFLVSFLVPCYVVYTSRMIPLGEDQKEDPEYPTRHEIRFTFTADEEPYVQEIVREIEATYAGYEPMPPEVGNGLVLDVVTGLNTIGTTKLYHCLFTDDW
ncbi:MAG TPA: hypothetical protein VH877_02265 [Polyangia bacterium]|nr:hypothetical protein [Polyangia bacterium]